MADKQYELKLSLSNGNTISAGTITAPQGEAGAKGATFTPSVSEAGVLSWTNDCGLTNPDPINIKGPKGDDAVITESDVASWGFQKIGSSLCYDTSASDTAGTWTVSIPNITALTEGLTIKIRLKTSYNSTTNTLNVNGLGAKTIYFRYGSKLTSHYAKESVLALTYTANAVSSGTDRSGWIVENIYDSTNTYQLRVYNTKPKTKSALYRYMICFVNNDGLLIPANNTSNSTATTKTLTTESFNLFDSIYYYNSTTTISANGQVGSGTLYKQLGIDLRYSFNTGTTLVAPNGVYLKVTEDGNQFKLATDTPVTQSLPTSDDGYYYCYLGRAYSTYQIELALEHPIYLYKNGIIQEYRAYTKSVAENALSKIPTVNNGTLTIQKNGTNVQTFSANQSENSIANIIVPTKVSELTNDSGFLTSHQDISGKANLIGSNYFTGRQSIGIDNTGYVLDVQTDTQDCGTVFGVEKTGSGYSGSSRIIIDGDGLENVELEIGGNAGTSGQVLTSQGYGKTPKWTTLTIPDISGKANLNGGNTFSGLQTFDTITASQIGVAVIEANTVVSAAKFLATDDGTKDGDDYFNVSYNQNNPFVNFGGSAGGCMLMCEGDEGTSGQVLTSRGTGQSPQWTTLSIPTITLNGTVTTSPSFWASTSGTNIAIGSSASSSNTGIAIGSNAKSRYYGISIGRNATNISSSNTSYYGDYSIIIGDGAKESANTGYRGENIVIGRSCIANRNYSIIMGVAISTPTDETVTHIGGASYTSTGRRLILGAGSTNFTYMNAAGASWTSASDIRDKTDIQEIDHALDFIKKLKPITYVMNCREDYLIRDNDNNPILDSNGKQQFDIEAHARGDKKKHRRFAGLSAQDTYKAMLDCYDGNNNYAQIVDNNKYDNPDDEYIEQYSMSYERLVPFLIKSIQEQQLQIEELKSKIA